MERLTWRDKTGQALYKMDNPQMEIGECERRVLDRLAEYEDEIDNGTLLKAPCKVGDTIYFVDEPLAEFNKIQEFVAKEIRYTKDECQVWIFDDLYIGADDFDNYAFLTREEAEKRLEELKNAERKKV